MTVNRRPIHPVEWSLLLLAGIWGVGYSIDKVALVELTPQAFNAVRYVAAAGVAVAVAWRVEGDLRLPRQDWGLVFAGGLLGHFASVALYMAGLARTSTIHAALIIAAAPIFVAAINAATRCEPLTPRVCGAVALSFAGIVLVIAAADHGAPGAATLVGDLMQVGASVLFALYLVLLKRLSPGATPWRVTAWTLVCATAFLLPAAAGEMSAIAWRGVSPVVWLAVAYSGILCQGVASVIWQAGVQRVGSTRASLYSFLPPVIAVAVGWAVLHEALTPWQAVGAAAVLAGLAMGRAPDDPRR